MMFKSILIATFLAGCQAESLRSASRDLSEAKIAGYEPNTKVTDHNAIDLDQAAMETQLGTESDAAFDLAKAIYEQGGNSKSYAEITVPALTTKVNKGDALSGVTSAGLPVTGTAYDEADVGATVLQFQYDTTSDQASYVNCQVGGLVEKNLVGCLASNGTVTIGSTTSSYSYDPAKSNKNGRTLQYFSTKANEKMRHDEDETKPYYDDFSKFFLYYGNQFDYTDQIIQAAFDKSSVTLGSRTVDFTDFATDYVARSQIIKKVSVFMGVAMYVIRELEDAIDDCVATNTERNAGGVNAVDEAVAFYTGSLEKADGSGDGKLMHALADKRCVNFKTCGENGDSIEGGSRVNIVIFDLFRSMKTNILDGECVKATEDKKKIVSQLFIPLVQGTLRYAQIRTTDDATNEDVAEGAAFALAVLPMVHNCSTTHAETIYKNMLPGSTEVDHKGVKSALEATYSCLGISCADVGGYIDEATQDYFADSAPCSGGAPTVQTPSTGGTSSTEESGGSDTNVGLIVGLTIGGLVVLGLIAMFVMRQKAGSVEFKSDNV